MSIMIEKNKNYNCIENRKTLSMLHCGNSDVAMDTECKIFVGNVPYQCTPDEFEKCFLGVEGFVKAEIITMYKTNMSRGFGFVTLKSHDDAEKLKKRADITFKGRPLRFTAYQNDSPRPPRVEMTNNYIHIDGIPEGKTRNWLRDIFSDYEPIGRYFIAMNHETGDMKSNGIIEILDDSNYKLLISKRWYEVDGFVMELSRYKIKNRDTDYDEFGFHAHNHFNNSENYDAHKSYNYRNQMDKLNKFNKFNKFVRHDNFDKHSMHNNKHSQDQKYQKYPKRINNHDLYSAYMAGKNTGLIMGINRGLKIAKNKRDAGPDKINKSNK
jgi:RNA recognition motif-containing protein